MTVPHLKQDFVRDTVREWIRHGKFSPGEQLPPDDLLAKEFKLNTRTVAAGLNQLVRENLLERAPRKGTVVKQHISMPSSNAVAVIAPNWGEIYSEMARTITHGLMAKNLFPVFIDQNLIEKKEEIISFLERFTSHQKPFGILVLGDIFFPYEYLQKNSAKMGNSIFFFRYHHSEFLPASKYVLVDYDSLGKQAAAYFADKGIRKLTFVSRVEKQYCGVHSSTQVQIFLAMRKYASEYGITIDESLFWRCHAGAKFEDIFIESQKDPAKKAEGFFGMDLDIVDHLFPQLHNMGIRQFSDIPILGYNNIALAEANGFDTFDLRPADTVKEALEILTGEKNESKIMITPQLVCHSKRIAKNSLK